MSDLDDARLSELKNDFTKNGYAWTSSFLAPESCELIYRYALAQVRFGKWTNDDKVFLGDDRGRSCYGDPMMETVLEHCQPLVEKIVGQPLWATYSFARLYCRGMALKRHRDRPECQYSASVSIGRDYSNLVEDEPDYEWSLYADGNATSSAIGSATIYQGCEVEHWREPLRGNQHLQLFIHYIDQDHPQAQQLKFDGRPWLGAPIGTKHIRRR